MLSEVSAEKKIIFFLNNLNGGGAERVVVKLINEFSYEGRNVELVLANKTGPYLSELAENVRVVDLKCRSKLLAILKLAIYLKKSNPAVLFSTITGANVIALLAKALSRSKIKTVIREANTPSMENMHLGLKSKVLIYVASKIYHRADAVICVSQDSCRDFINFFRKVDRSKVNVIYNPVVDEEFIAKSKAEVVVSTPWARKYKYFLSVGRLTEQKDFKLLLEAFRRVRNEKNCKLIILGEGPLRESLEIEIEKLKITEDVWLPGFIENPYPYMREASSFVLTSRWEGLPNVLIQAIAAGTDVISTNCPSGPREILKNGKLGTLVNVGDAEGLAEAMLKNLETPSTNNMKVHSQQDMKERFGVSKIVSEYMRIVSAS